jgi:hypothetical protein
MSSLTTFAAEYRHEALEATDSQDIDEIHRWVYTIGKELLYIHGKIDEIKRLCENQNVSKGVGSQSSSSNTQAVTCNLDQLMSRVELGAVTDLQVPLILLHAGYGGRGKSLTNILRKNTFVEAASHTFPTEQASMLVDQIYTQGIKANVNRITYEKKMINKFNGIFGVSFVIDDLFVDLFVELTFSFVCRIIEILLQRHSTTFCLLKF